MEGVKILETGRLRFHLPAVWSWAIDFSYMGFSLLIYKGKTTSTSWESFECYKTMKIYLPAQPLLILSPSPFLPIPLSMRY